MQLPAYQDNSVPTSKAEITGKAKNMVPSENGLRMLLPNKPPITKPDVVTCAKMNGTE